MQPVRPNLIRWANAVRANPGAYNPNYIGTAVETLPMAMRPDPRIVGQRPRGYFVHPFPADDPQLAMQMLNAGFAPSMPLQPTMTSGNNMMDVRF